MKMSDCGVRYSILPSDSAIIVEVLQTKLLRKHKYFLPFESFTGDLEYFQHQPERSKLSIEIDPQSITCRDRRFRVKRQRRVAKHAKEFVLNAALRRVQFSSQQISAKPLRGFVVEGTLTGHGVKQPLKMNTIFVLSDTDHLEIEGDFIFRFSEFGLIAPSSLFGMIRISDQALVQFHFHAARTK